MEVRLDWYGGEAGVVRYCGRYHRIHPLKAHARSMLNNSQTI